MDPCAFYLAAALASFAHVGVPFEGKELVDEPLERHHRVPEAQMTCQSCRCRTNCDDGQQQQLVLLLLVRFETCAVG